MVALNATKLTVCMLCRNRGRKRQDDPGNDLDHHPPLRHPGHLCRRYDSHEHTQNWQRRALLKGTEAAPLPDGFLQD